MHKLNQELEEIQNEPKLLVAADKTHNHYNVDPADYKKLIEKDINKDYKKETTRNVQNVNQAHKSIVKKLGIKDRVLKTTERQCFISLKDHKEDSDKTPSVDYLTLINVRLADSVTRSYQKL